MAIRIAFQKTMQYLVTKKRRNERDLDKEHELSDLWSQAAVHVNEFDKNLAGSFGEISSYWLEPEKWSNEERDKVEFNLEEIDKVVAKQLGMESLTCKPLVKDGASELILAGSNAAQDIGEHDNFASPINKIISMFVDLSNTHSDLLREIERAVDKEGSIDQKFLYLDPLSVKKWKKLIASNEYRTYRDCLSALCSFLKSQEWKDIVTETSLSTIIDLGVGAGEKDNLVLKSFLREANTDRLISFVLIDTSFPMLENTLESLVEFSTRSYEHVKIVAIRADFMQLSSLKNYINPEGGVSAFFMLGSTFCNIKESLFMNTLYKCTKEGDVFVIGVETYEREEEVNNKLKETFDHEALRDLAILPLRMVSGANEKRIKDSITIEIAKMPGFSDIPKSVTALIKAQLGDDEITLATSTRYIKTELIDFITTDYDFKFKGYYPSKENPFYMHLLFKRKVNKNG